jgi:hypothetical protein
VELRPIVGIPGAVVLGDPVQLPDGLQTMAVAPGQGYALVQTADRGETSLLPITPAGVGTLVPISGALANPDGIEFSPSASVAALFSRQRQVIQVIGGLPAAPQVVRNVDMAALRGFAGTFAVSDDGRVLLLAVADGDTSVLNALPANGDVRMVARAGTISAIRFFPGTLDAVAADPQFNQILLVSGGGGLRVIATAADGVSTPVDIEAMTVNRVLVVNQGNQSLLDIDLNATTANPVACPFSPAGLRRLRQKSAFLVMDADRGGAWAIDAGDVQERVSFIPGVYRSRGGGQ